MPPSLDPHASLESGVRATRTVSVTPPALRVSDSIAALCRLSEAVVRAGSVQAVLEVALDGLCGSLGVSRASVLLLDPDGVMRFKGWRGLSDGYRAAVEGHSPWAPGTINAQPVLVPDVDAAEISAELKATVRAEGIRSLAFIPLQDHEGLLGKFMVYRADVHQFSPEEVGLAQIVANQISFVLGRHRVIERLHRSEERVRVALAAGGMGDWEWDSRTNRIDWSPTLEKIHGLETGCFGGRFEDFLSDIHPDDRAHVLQNIQSTLESSRDSYEVQYRIIRPDGELRWLEAHGRVIRGPDSTPTGMTGVCQDITERKLAESHLRESEARFRAMADSAPVLIWMSGPDKGGVYFNRPWLEFTGRTLDQERGAGWLEAVHADDMPALAACEDAFRHRKTFTTRFRLRRHDGAYRWVLDTGTPRFDQRGEFQGFIGSCIDVTEIEDARAALAAHRDRLETLVAQRTAELEASHQQLRITERMAAIGTLAAGLGHDMANLLLPIRTHLETLQMQGALPPALGKDVEAIGQCTQYLQRLTNGLRMLAVDPAESRGEDRTSPATWWLDVAGLLRSVVPAGIDLRATIPDALPELAIQPHRLAQAVFNLVSNAADAMRARGWGTIAVSFEVAADGVLVRVVDNGPGMPEDVRRRASEPFFTTKVRTKSTGLGLSLVHSVVQSAGGRVQIESRLGKGTSVELLLPPASAPAERPGACVTLRNPVRRAFVAGLLRQMGYEVSDSAQDGAHLAVLEPCAASAAHARRVRSSNPAARLVVLGAPDPELWSGLSPITIPESAPLSTIRNGIHTAIAEVQT